MSNSLLSLFKKEQPWANRSRLSFKKSDHEGIALVTLYKRETLSKSRMISLKKSNISDLLMIRANCSKKISNLLKKTYYCMFLTNLDSFSPFVCPRANRLSCYLLSRSFLKSKGSDSFSSLFKKEQQWANWSLRSLKKWPWAIRS